ncbi:hypothetical protein ONZ45_g4597 [Pleurotus djamor]|nr:hypothetical protein ONZ45_g4597 [Pleurotus djamor]
MENTYPEEDQYDVPADTQLEETQQSTQPASQKEGGIDSHLWGYLQPCSSTLTRIDFWKIRPKYAIGRNHTGNEIILPGFKISNYHCVIMWDGKEDNSGCVTVQDLSSNGTYINGQKIGRGNTKILREGNELAFGTSTPQPHNKGIEDYRFVYRHLAAGPPVDGLYKYYDLSIELGKGSFATVMKAVHLATGEWVAIKMIQDKKSSANGTHGGSDSNTKKNAFFREISIMEKLKHPNICELREVFIQKDNGTINLVLELVEGGDLLDYILNNNGLSEAAAKHITYQMCDALSYIHSEGVAHRDLKPENILLTNDTPPRVKVADFGLAKVVDSLTMLRTMCGTPSYLAPEVVKQQEREGYDNLVDSWSVGVIVFSMLTNAGPFIEDENQRDIRMRILERQIDWGTLSAAKVTPEAESFIRALLTFDPSHRMTLSDSLFHPWLQGYQPHYPPSNFLCNRLQLGGSSSTSSIPKDVSMLSEIAEEEEYPPAGKASGSGLPREHSSSQRLQRRARVLEEAAEGKGEILEPSQEMIDAVMKHQDAESDASNSPPHKAGHKRALDEDAEMESAAEEDTSNGKRKGKGKASPGSPSPRKGKGRAKASAGVQKSKGPNGRARGAAAEDDDGATHLRRSSRHTQATPQKFPRFN